MRTKLTIFALAGTVLALVAAGGASVNADDNNNDNESTESTDNSGDNVAEATPGLETIDISQSEILVVRCDNQVIQTVALDPQLLVITCGQRLSNEPARTQEIRRRPWRPWRN